MHMKASSKLFKKGMIILWSGLIADIPGGWHLCDGTNDTPNLKNSFVIGAGASYVVGATGGTTMHSHTGTTSSHNHTLVVGPGLEDGVGHAPGTTSKTVSFTTDSGNGLPPYYALAYIMKL